MWVYGDGCWFTERGDPNRENASQLMWPDEWDESPRVRALVEAGHRFTELSYISKYHKSLRYPSRSSGVDSPEMWFLDDGFGVAKRWETLVDLTTDKWELMDRAAHRALPGNRGLWRGDAVEKHYLFEDLGTAMMFKLHWCQGT